MMKLTIGAATAAVLLLSACHKKPPEPQNTTMELPVAQPQPPAPPPPPQPAPKPKVEKPVALPADHAEPSEEEQMREDAEATGMTSRTTTGNDAPTSGGNSTEH